jgi:hypothetical protein
MENFFALNSSEQHLANKIIVSTDFLTMKSYQNDWEYAGFYPGGAGMDPAAEIRGNWMPADI